VKGLEEQLPTPKELLFGEGKAAGDELCRRMMYYARSSFLSYQGIAGSILKIFMR